MNIYTYPPMLVVIDAGKRTYTRYVGKKKHFAAVAVDRLLTADEIESLRCNPSELVDVPPPHGSAA